MKRIRNGFSLFLATGLLLGLTAAPAFADWFENVECNGNCGQMTLNQVCTRRSPAGRAVGVACDDTANPRAGGVACGTGNGRCIRFTLNGNQLLSTYCEDRGGADATVICR